MGEVNSEREGCGVGGGGGVSITAGLITHVEERGLYRQSPDQTLKDFQQEDEGGFAFQRALSGCNVKNKYITDTERCKSGGKGGR